MGKQLIYQVAVGEVPAFYELCIESVADYAYRWGFKHIVQREPQLRIKPLASQRSVNALRLGYLPILEKEAALAFLDSYEAICILDADIYVTKHAENVFSGVKTDFAGVLERDMPLTPAYLDKIRKHSEGQFRSLTDVDWQWNQAGAAYYNMGVMILNQSILPYLHGQTPTEFLRRPEFARFINGEGHWKWSTDQTLLNWWVKKSGMTVTAMDWRFNALYGAVESLTGAHFVHFFLSAKQQPGAIEKIIEGFRHHA